MSDVVRDMRMAARRLRQAPGFASVAVLTLALGIAATSAIFSVVDAVVLRPLPYDHADRLVRVTADLQRLGVSDIGLSASGAVRLPRSHRPVRRHHGHLAHHREPHRVLAPRARGDGPCRADVLPDARRAAATGPAVWPAGLPHRHRHGGRDQRRTVAAGLRRRPPRDRTEAPDRQRRLRDRRRHPAVVPPSQRDARNRRRGVGAGRLDHGAVSRAGARPPIPASRHRAAEAGRDGRRPRRRAWRRWAPSFGAATRRTIPSAPAGRRACCR